MCWGFVSRTLGDFGRKKPFRKREIKRTFIKEKVVGINDLIMREGIKEARQMSLQELLQERFGQLPEWVNRKLEDASVQDLQTWLPRVLKAQNLEDVINKAREIKISEPDSQASAEDSEDLAIMEQRKNEPTIPHEKVLEELKKGFES